MILTAFVLVSVMLGAPPADGVGTTSDVRARLRLRFDTVWPCEELSEGALFFGNPGPPNNRKAEIARCRVPVFEESLGPGEVLQGGCVVARSLPHPVRALTAFVRWCPASAVGATVPEWVLQVGVLDPDRRRLRYQEVRYPYAVTPETGISGSIARSGGWTTDARYFWFNSWPLGDSAPTKGHHLETSAVFAADAVERVPFAWTIKAASADEVRVSTVTALHVRRDCRFRTIEELSRVPDRCMRGPRGLLSLGRDNCRIDAVISGDLRRPKLRAHERPRRPRGHLLGQ